MSCSARSTLRSLRWPTVGFVCLSVWVGLVSHAWAQAGGGGSFGSSSSGGGGGGFSGGGGSGGGDGGAIIYLIQLTIEHPLIGIPIWIVLGLLYYYVTRQVKEVRITRTIRRGRKVQEERLLQQTLQAITARDPQFDKALFVQRARKAFITTQYAWSDQDLSRCRAFVSDGVHERFQLYIDMQKAENKRNRMRDVEVLELQWVCVTSDPGFDTIHVKFVARAISYDEDLTTGKRVGGNSDRVPITFSEIWSFSRRPGIQTNPEASLLEGTCPNCGGSVEIVDRAQCPHCGSVVNSGKYDWVLAEITQLEEWIVPPARHRVSGWDRIAARDRELNFQHIEDRASVIFWRCMMAIYFDNFGLARAVIWSGRDTLPSLWRIPVGEYWRTPAVGSVEVKRAEPARSESDWDRLYVLVRWSASRASGDRRKPRQLDLQRIYSHEMVLKRKPNAVSHADRAFSTYSCQSCGAPIAVGHESRCSWCGVALNDGTTDWVLETVGIYRPVPAFLREDRLDDLDNLGLGVERLETDRLVNEPELLQSLARMVAADGQLHDKEREWLARFAQRRGVAGERFDEIIRAATDNQQDIELPTDPGQARSFMDHLIRAALIDGRIHSRERRLLRSAAAQIGWSAADLKLAIRRNRGELYRQAREIITATVVAEPRPPRDRLS